MVWTIAKDHLKTESFEILPSKGRDFECFQILNDEISNPHCTVGI